MPAGDLYAALGVAPTATPEELKEAYRRRALECHPDKAGAGAPQPGAADFTEVQRAWDVLRDPQARAAYDAERARDGGLSPTQREALFARATHVSGTITEDDLDYPDDDSGGGAGAPTFRCRCGDAIPVEAGGSGAVVSCSSCSLRYRVELLPPVGSSG